jgi:phosphocarrier protein
VTGAFVLDDDRKPRARVTICNRKGLHARASAKFVKCAEMFNATVRVTRDDRTVGGTSIMSLMALAAGPGTEIVLEAEGPGEVRLRRGDRSGEPQGVSAAQPELRLPSRKRRPASW